jgi:hypothetical protein
VVVAENEMAAITKNEINFFILFLKINLLQMFLIKSFNKFF